MKTQELNLNDLNVTELSDVELQQVVGGSGLSYAAGWVVGYTVGIVADFVAAGTFAVQVMINSAGGNTGSGGQMA